MIAESLLQNIVVGCSVRSWPMPLSRALSHIHFCALSNAAMYFASHEEAAMVCCFQTAQDMALDPRFHVNPPTLCCVSGQLTQSESVKPKS